MATPDSIAVRFDSNSSLFLSLAELATGFTDAGLELHAIGGVVVLTWTEVCRTTRPITTSDFDTVIPASCCETESAAEIHGRKLAGLRERLGYTKEHPGRLKGCSFDHVDLPYRMDFVVGSRAYGKVTELPRQRISKKTGLYAARNEWIDFVDEN